MAKKKRHHYIPKFYLEGFIDPHFKPYIWVYEKGNPNITKATATNIAVQKHYYSFTTAEGERDSETIENILAAFESHASRILPKIKSHQSLEDQERYLFAGFLALMMSRVPNTRENVQKAAAQILKKINKKIASNSEHFDAFIKKFQEETGEIVKLPIEKLREFILSDDMYTIEVAPVFSLFILTSTCRDLAHIFFDMKWSFLMATDDFKFVTSDNPLCYLDPTQDLKSWYPVGLANRNIEVTFPLSKDFAFLGTWIKKEGYVQSSNRIVKSVNHRTCLNASRFVFASEKSDGLSRIVQRYKDSAPRLEVR